ncbi:ZN879 protein, partial [Polypterus senegalus]|nr:ZN879 protein [Polypterus senegalus]
LCNAADKKVYHCMECGSNFWGHACLKIQWIHTGETPYLCGKHFSQLYHQRVHTGDKP